MKRYLTLIVATLLMAGSAKALETGRLSFATDLATVAPASSHQDKVSSDRQNASSASAAPTGSARAILATGTELTQDGGFESGGYPDQYGFSTLSSAWTWSGTGSFLSLIHI